MGKHGHPLPPPSASASPSPSLSPLPPSPPAPPCPSASSVCSSSPTSSSSPPDARKPHPPIKRHGFRSAIRVSRRTAPPSLKKRKPRNGFAAGVCAPGNALSNGIRQPQNSLVDRPRKAAASRPARGASAGILVREPGDVCVRQCKGENGGNEWAELNYPYIPGLNNDLARLCLARVQRSDYDQFFYVNRKFCALAESGELYKIRRANRIVEHWVYMLASGQFDWQAFDPKSGRWRKLPRIDADYCYYSSDKESLSVGTQLMVVGRHAVEGLVIWRYDLISNSWSPGPMMITPRCLYAWASCGSFAYVAGGLTLSGECLQSAERYDPESKRWESLPDLKVRRKLCAGCYMDGKFYVIGGENQDGDLTCGEVYDPVQQAWTLIEKILPAGTARSFPGAPPLIAVVKNELYALEAESNQLKVYVKATNSWRVLGEAPVRADLASGWGIAFKALGDELLVIGGARKTDQAGQGDGMYKCKPDLNGGSLRWSFVTKLVPFGPFVFNCAIMAA